MGNSRLKTLCQRTPLLQRMPGLALGAAAKAHEPGKRAAAAPGRQAPVRGRGRGASPGAGWGHRPPNPAAQWASWTWPAPMAWPLCDAPGSHPRAEQRESKLVGEVEVMREGVAAADWVSKHCLIPGSRFCAYFWIASMDW
jgi:hypothetical protein